MPRSEKLLFLISAFILGNLNLSSLCLAQISECEAFVADLRSEEAQASGRLARAEASELLNLLELAGAEIETSAQQLLNQWNHERRRQRKPAMAATTIAAMARLQELTPPESVHGISAATRSLEIVIQHDPYFRSMAGSPPLKRGLDRMPLSLHAVAATESTLSHFERHLFTNTPLRCGPHLAALSALHVFEPSLSDDMQLVISGLLRISRRRDH